jgi:hypothetical protein
LTKPRINFQLFILVVAALYPSIRPELALTALQNALNNDTTCSPELKNAIHEFTDLEDREVRQFSRSNPELGQ